MTTPSAISRITAHAERASKLMDDTDKTDQMAGPILDEYEKSLKRFQAGVSDIDAKRKALDAALPAFGNAAALMDKAFQDEKPPAAGASVNGEQQVIKPQDVAKVEAVLDHANHPMPPSSPSP
jgi:exonuclease VII small subunit